MPTKLTDTSTNGPSWETVLWKSKVLHELRSGMPCGFPACTLGVREMADLVTGGLFTLGFPPQSGDCLCLEMGDDMVECCVFRVRDEFHCEELESATPRRLRYSEAELTMHTLNRERFYECVAQDLGISGQITQLATGVWEIGRKQLPKREIAKVIFIEPGVPSAVLELTLMRDPFTAICLLHLGKPLVCDWHSDKTLVRGALSIQDGRFASGVFEDLAASLRINPNLATDAPKEMDNRNQPSPILQPAQRNENHHEVADYELIELTSPIFADWKKLVLRDLRAPISHIQAFRLGATNMAKLVDKQIFEPAEPLDDLPATIELDVDSADESYEIVQKGDEIHCYKFTFHPSPRKVCKFTAQEFAPHQLIRENFYALMARDLGLTAQVCQLESGLWELGRKNIAGQGRARVIFVEQGVEKNAIIACIAVHGYKTNCLLFNGNPPAQISVPEKYVVSSPVHIVNGIFSSEYSEDVVASRPDMNPRTGVDISVNPPELWIAGRMYQLPSDRNHPTMGARYWAYLFENPRVSIDCWNLEREVRPELKTAVSVAMGSDSRMDRKAIRELDQAILDKKSELDEAMRDQRASEFEISELNDQLAKLTEKKSADTGLSGVVRFLGDPEKVKARRRVRKALESIVVHISKKDSDLGKVMQEAAGEGSEVYLNPPADWNL